MANYLFFSINASWAFHFETDLELMYELLQEGHEVFALVCDRVLPTCYSNPTHLKPGCIKCVARRRAAFNKIKLPSKNIFSLTKKGIDFSQIPLTFSSQTELEHFELDGINMGKWVISTLMKEDDEHLVDVKKEAERIYKLLSTSYLVACNFSRLIKQVKFDGVYLLNGRLAEYAPVVQICKKEGVNFFIHERGGVLDRYFLGKNYLPQQLAPMAAEIKNLWETIPASEKTVVATQWFMDRRQKVQQGWIPFTVGQEDGRMPVGWNPLKRNIAIFNGALSEFWVFEEWRNTGGFAQNEIIEKLIVSFLEDSTFHFYLRVHPNLRDSQNTQMRELKALHEKKYKNLSIIWPEDPIDTYELVEQSEKVLTFGSTVGVEACFWGKPSILWGRASYETLDCVYKPSSVEEIEELLRDTLPAKPKEAALPYGLWEMRRGRKFKHYQPTGLTSGTFQGVKIIPELNWKDKLEIRVDAKINSFMKKFSALKSFTRE